MNTLNKPKSKGLFKYFVAAISRENKPAGKGPGYKKEKEGRKLSETGEVVVLSSPQ